MKKILYITSSILMSITFLACTPAAEINEGYETMVYVEGGTFEMGGTDEESFENEKPVHKVTLSSYYISRYEVTQGLWHDVMGENQSEFDGLKNNPVEMVNWYDCIEFCNKLSERDGLQKVYKIDKEWRDPDNTNKLDDIKWTVTINESANGYRLPTEAQWEYAARGGNESKGYKYSGSRNVEDVAWFDGYDYGDGKGNSDNKTHTVGRKQPNELGLYDMSGNVWEWCFDWYGDYTTDDVVDPIGADHGDGRVIRGGSYGNIALGCLSSLRLLDRASHRHSKCGLRLVRFP